MSARRASLGRLACTRIGVWLVLSALLVAAVLVPPLLWTLLLACLVILSFDLVPFRAPTPAPVARPAPRAETAPRSPPRY
jgi:hypothetical protein